MSWTSLLLLLLHRLFRVFILVGLFRDFFLCSSLSSSRAFFSLGCVSSALGSSSSLLPSCLAAASHGSHNGIPPMWLVALFFSSHATLLRLLVGALRCAIAVFLAGHPFLRCLLAFEISLHSVEFSLVYYADFIHLLTFSVSF